MPAELKIRFEGTAPGLQEGRLSLGAFGDSLNILLASLRRIASNIVSDALNTGQQARVGRLATEARHLDIEIKELITTSSGFDSVITLSTPQGELLPLFGDLAETATGELIESIYQESHGKLKNAQVRKYFTSLPAGIQRQSYVLHSNGQVMREVTIQDVNLPEVPPDLPYLAEYKGNVVGVGFEPGKLEVKIRTAPATTIAFTATAPQVELALKCRNEVVHAMAVVEGGTRRLLKIRDIHTAARGTTCSRDGDLRAVGRIVEAPCHMNVEPWSDRITRGGLLDLHAESIRRFGGDTSPDAQEGCLERSLGAAWNAELYSNEPDAVSGLCFAGCLLFYLIMNHCFVDGNKRVAWAACMECLRTLGLTVNVTDDEAEQYCFSVIRRDVKNATDVSLWLAPKLEAFEA